VPPAHRSAVFSTSLNYLKEGDKITGKSEFKMQDQDARTMDWKATREKSEGK
jgi:hypothetical protein